VGCDVNASHASSRDEQTAQENAEEQLEQLLDGNVGLSQHFNVRLQAVLVVNLRVSVLPTCAKK